MTEPFVCCICPTRDRPEFLKRAVECFKAQTYANKTMVILDSGLGHSYSYHSNPTDDPLPGEIWHWRKPYAGRSIGWLRNEIIRHMEAPDAPTVMAHWDDDDWSCPTRLAEQVAFLESSGKDVVGYSDMAFYDVTKDKVTLYTSHDQKYVLGTSLLYRRALWEEIPFPDMNDEDVAWLRQVGAARIGRQSSLVEGAPRMVATIHKGNTSPKKGARYQKASPELDAAVRACIGRGLVAQ